MDKIKRIARRLDKEGANTDLVVLNRVMGELIEELSNELEDRAYVDRDRCEITSDFEVVVVVGMIPENITTLEKLSGDLIGLQIKLEDYFATHPVYIYGGGSAGEIVSIEDGAIIIKCYYKVYNKV